MATFTADELSILYLRGFEPASNYAPLKYRNCSYVGGNANCQVADGVPFEIYPLGTLQGFLNGSFIGQSAIVWKSKIAAPSTSTPPGAAGIEIVGGSHSEGGDTVVDLTIYFIDEDGNRLPNEFFLTTYNQFNAESIFKDSNIYLTLCYRTDLSDPQMLFGIKYDRWYTDLYSVYHMATDKAVCLANQGIGVINQPFYDWYHENKDSDWYDDQSGEPEMTPGGGGGSLYRPNTNDDFPARPAFDICNTDFIRLYQIDGTSLSQLGNFLWDPSFFSSIVKNWASPFDNIIGLFLNPLDSSELNTAAANIQIGNVATGISGNRLQDGWVRKDMGEVNIDEMYGGFQDYLTGLSIYLPYIGKRDLNPDFCMAGRIHLVYDIDIFTGNCVAHIKAIRKGKSYVVESYNGNVNSNIPINGANYFQAYQAAFNGLSGIMTAPLNNPLGMVGGALFAAANTKPAYNKSSTLTGSYGRLGVQQPKIFFDTPQYKSGEGFKSLNGYISNMTYPLSTCKDYVRVKYIDLSGLNAPESVKDSILQKLQSGVYIHKAVTP